MILPWLEATNWLARALAIPGLKATGKFGLKRWWRRQFKKVIGSTASEYFIAYANLEVNPLVLRSVSNLQQQLARFPLVKPNHPDMFFSAQKVVSGSELRAVSYIGTSLVADGGIVAKVVADDAIADKLDIDFISFGAMSNFKTLDVFANPANRLAGYSDKDSLFKSKSNGNPLCDFPAGYDYGLILKIHPQQFPGRTWICCAGIGEWGTSGSTWFLAKKWKEIAKRVSERDQFACVIQVKPGQDESARLHHFEK